MTSSNQGLHCASQPSTFTVNMAASGCECGEWGGWGGGGGFKCGWLRTTWFDSGVRTQQPGDGRRAVHDGSLLGRHLSEVHLKVAARRGALALQAELRCYIF